MQGERIQTEIEAAAGELIASGAETGLQVAVVKVAVMRNRFAAGDLTTAARIDNIVARALT